MSLLKLGQFPALSCALELVRPGVSATLPFWRLSESEQFYLGGGVQFLFSGSSFYIYPIGMWLRIN